MKVTAAYLKRVAHDWQRAFEVAHMKPAPVIVWERGWFFIKNEPKRRYRRAALEEMTKVLRKGFKD